MDDSRPSKRTRQACEQCRRKKSRCPGERPVCSYCQRLGQPCEYAGDEEPDYARKMEQRIKGIEGKIDALMDCFSNQNPPVLLSPTTTLTARQLCPEPVTETSATPSIPSSSLAQNAQQLFLTYCNFQPLPLFRHGSFSATSENRDPELLLAMQALGLRFSGAGIADAVIDRQIKDWSESSRRMAMTRVIEGSVELSTLQAFCILTLIDHTAGHTLKAGVNTRLATYLLQNLRVGSSEMPNLEDERDERVLCRWSLHMLANLVGEPTSVPGTRLAYSVQSTAQNKKDPGLVGCAIQLSEVWGMAQSYAAAPITADSPPPWAPQSDYTRITFRHTEFESLTPLRYRLHETRLDELTWADLQQRRDFWGHCLFFQLIFHAIPCLLNHPLLLSTRLRNFRHTMPQSFIRHSFEQITLHAGWVLHFIDLLEMKNYEVSDPTLGQCVVIVATIYLQHSFVDDVFFREKAQFGYDRCLSFLCRMAVRWPNIERQVENLRTLRSSISAGDVQNSQQIWSVNVHLLWDILIATPPKQTATDIFGPGLAKDSALHADSSTPDPEFELIGSAGISGHRTVAKNLVTYYPPEHVLQPTPPDVSALLGEPGMGITGTGNNALFQPQDYRRFIDNWLDLPT
ncbi:hypothetical protein BDW59DRAFT_166896 [Aspergillus cavernicola]|uniref:Zn(2)-C6 fungal-type domain-containing protein n=1 Tax=Aspergillus cavernicola TaxID=176166 RepID=A0ABR4HIB2_9EURO